MSSSTDSSTDSSTPQGTVAPISSERCKALAKGTKNDCERSSICAKCLQIDGCMIDSTGDCIAQGFGNYDRFLDFKVAEAIDMVLPKALENTSAPVNSTMYFHFRALDAVYCKANDTTCSRCIQENFWAPASLQKPDSRYCVGEDGCVCIDNCELPVDQACKQTAIAEDEMPVPAAADTATPTPWITGSSDTIRSGIPSSVWLVVAIITALGVGVAIARRRRSNGKIRRAPFAIPVLNEDFSPHARTFSTSFELSRLQQTSSTPPPPAPPSTIGELDPELEPYSWSFRQGDAATTSHRSFRRMS